MLALAAFVLILPLNAAAPAGENVVLTFQGKDSLTTNTFKVGDKWELRWDSPRFLHITLLSPEGATLVGTSGSGKGALFVPRGGTYYLQINSGETEAATSWQVSVVEIGTAVAGDKTDPATNPNYVPLATIPSPGQANPAPVSPIPAAPMTSAAPSTEPPSHSVVVIKGDEGEGTGFLVKTAEGPVVITNLHVLAANPHIKILTTTGEEITILSLKGAVDRDLAMIGIQDDHYSYLTLATNVEETAQTGDDLITPGNSEGGEVVLNTKGKVVAIGPQQIEFSNPIYHGNSGGPVFHTASGKVVAVVTQARKVGISDDLDKASFENKGSAITGSMRYFGYRIDTVPSWEPYDWKRYLNETTFLKEFHKQSRYLDSFLNGARYEKAHLAQAGDGAGPPDSKFYLSDEKLRTADSNFHQLSGSSDSSQRLDAVREMMRMNLQGFSDSDMTSIQNSHNFYSFDQLQAKQEIEYRKFLKSELDTIGGNISDLGH